ncbi:MULTISPECIES: RnfABCDGE type electron transport complex subunit A [Eubacterium]|jgi:electron transport complex protein RnfA|uniref:electron transport complex protein RnfA n=1 Tax=Eubacterium TaxID=1730 RepID=UPI000334C0AB|nr:MULTISPECIES: RnfABCDGE type electron transport complex subunit A [unclassified Eubacterium (in: firmicutes)]MCJ7965918.1 RnfABCDGE type electron transport complex subunit A [Lachnospiraceae bacterium NSJ-171]MEE0294419.1 RnfABCDGE type electron transport complex subunit A [Eubacterium sp.]CDA28152.1 electron transport complex RnfABCDGE type A subunit [Eubacterium sp. CAG:156]RGG66595.1 RnfABCDGE type electron transport complex subunit A [Eubacterium sp. AF17-7]RHR36497.1 RnfABCDGE type ele
MVQCMLIAVAAALVNNVVLSQFLGLCPFLGVSKKTDTAAGMGAAVIFVILIASSVTYGIYYGILKPFNLEYLQTIVFILVIAALVQLVEMILKKYVKPLYQALGVYLPLITTNCAVLGVAISNIDDGYTFGQSLANSLGTSVGFLIAIVILAGIREKSENNNIPKPFQGTPMVLIASGLMAIAFTGFTGII